MRFRERQKYKKEIESETGEWKYIVQYRESERDSLEEREGLKRENGKQRKMD